MPKNKVFGQAEGGGNAIVSEGDAPDNIYFVCGFGR